MSQPMPQHMPIWFQVKGESDKAYAAFSLYREMPMGQRSIFAVAEQLGAKISERNRRLREAPSHFRDWAKKHHWTVRVRALHKFMMAEAIQNLRRECARKADAENGAGTQVAQISNHRFEINAARQAGHDMPHDRGSTRHGMPERREGIGHDLPAACRPKPA